MSENVRGRVELDCNSYIASITQMIEGTNKFKKDVQNVENAINNVAKSKIEAYIKVKKEPAIMQIKEVKEAINRIGKNRAIEIAVGGMAKEKLRSIGHTIGDLTGRPHRIIFDAVNRTRHVIASIRDSIFNLKTLAAGIIFGGAAKGLFNWTLGSAMKNEDYLTTLQTVLNSKKKGSQALSWAYKTAALTPFNSDDVVKGVSDLATIKLDYKKFLMPLGNLAKVKNRPLEQAIFFMSKLSAGSMGHAVMLGRDLGISREMWEKAGMKFNKGGEMLNTPKQAEEALLKIMKNNHWDKIMANQSKNASGRISNIGDTIEAMGRGVAGVDEHGKIQKGGAFAEFKKQIEAVQPILEHLQHSKAFDNIKKNINGLVATGGVRLTKWLQDIEKHPEKIDQAFNKAKNGIKEFAEDFKLIGSVAKTVFDMLKPVLKLIVAHPKTAMGLWAGFKFGPGLISNLTKMPGRIRKIKSEFIVLKTILSTLKNFKLNKLKDMFTIFKNFKHIKSAGGALSPFLSKLKLLGSKAKDFAKLIPKAFKNISSAIKNPISSLKKFKDFLGTVSFNIKSFGNIAKQTLKNKFIDFIKKIPSTALKAFKKFGNAMKSSIKNIGKLGNVLKVKFKSIGKFMKTLGKDAKYLGKLIGTNLAKGFKKISSATKIVIKNISKFANILKLKGKVVAKFIKNLAKDAKWLVKMVGGKLKLLLNVVKIVGRGMVRTILRVTAAMLANPVVAIIAAIIAACILLYEAWKHNWGGIRDKTYAVINFIKEKVKDIKDAFEYVKKKCSDFKKKIVDMWNDIKTVLSHPIQAVVSLVQHGNLSGVKEHALGTSYFGGGWTWVGEKGPELMKLSPGAQIMDNRSSMRKANSNGQVILNVNAVVREEADISKFADKFAEMLYRKQLNRA